MKMLLLTLLLLTSAAQAEQWLVNGRTYNGTFHKFSVDHTKVYVTSDRDNYKGSWIKITSLDPATRVRLKVATPQEQAAVQAQREQNRQLEAQAATLAATQAEQNRQLDLQALAQIQKEQTRLVQAQAYAPSTSAYAASLQVQNQGQLSSRPSSSIYTPRYSGYRYSGYRSYGNGYYNYGYSPFRYSHYYYPRTGYRHYSSYGYIPRAHVTQYHAPHVHSSGGIHVVQPILLWNR